MLYFTNFEDRDARLLDLQRVSSFEDILLELEDAIDRGSITLSEAITILQG